MSDGTIVTFYSYKGGVGRSFLLANVATLLAVWGYRVLAIDWDIEAPGLSAYFRPWLKGTRHPGLVELVQRFASGKEPDWRRHVTRIDIPGAEGRLALMPAGQQGSRNYLSGVQALDWSSLYDEHDLGGFLEQRRQEWKADFDFVLIDSRTGVTDIGGICTVQMPDFLVFVFTANHQSFDGALDVARRALAARQRLPVDRSGLLTLPVLSRFDTREEYKLAESWLSLFHRKLPPFYEDWIDEGLEPARVLDLTRVPYLTYWSFGEKLPVLEETRDDPDSISYYLANVAALLALRLGDSHLLVRSRDAFLDKARAGGTQREENEPAFDVFLSYSPEDFSYARSLALALGKSHLRVFFDAEEVTTGESIRAMLDLRLRQATHFVLLFGRSASRSSLQFFEARSFLERHDPDRQRFLPVLLPGVSSQDLPAEFRRFAALEASRLKPAEVSLEIVRMLGRGRQKPG